MAGSSWVVTIDMPGVFSKDPLHYHRPGCCVPGEAAAGHHEKEADKLSASLQKQPADPGVHTAVGAWYDSVVARKQSFILLRHVETAVKACAKCLPGSAQLDKQAGLQRCIAEMLGQLPDMNVRYRLGDAVFHLMRPQCPATRMHSEEFTAMRQYTLQQQRKSACEACFPAATPAITDRPQPAAVVTQEPAPAKRARPADLVDDVRQAYPKLLRKTCEEALAETLAKASEVFEAQLKVLDETQQAERAQQLVRHKQEADKLMHDYNRLKDILIDGTNLTLQGIAERFSAAPSSS